MDVPLSNDDIMKILNKNGIDANFVQYHQLKNMEKIDDVLPCILLYELHFPIGHWCTIFVNHEGLNYFDSTGHIPDQLLETNFDNPKSRESLGADFTFLNALLYDYMARHKCKLIYNEYKLQSENSNTCGCWTAVRLLTQGLTNNEFNNIWKQYHIKQRQEKVIKLFHSL